VAEAPPHLFECLSRTELKACLAVAFVAKAADYKSYGIDRYATPGTEGPTDSWIELLKRTIRLLALEHEVQFQGVEAKRDGRMLCSVVEPRNRLYIKHMESGGMPHIGDALRTAIEMSQGWQGFDAEPLRSALADVEANLDELRADVDTDKLAAVLKLRQRALAEVGYVPDEGEIN
jgi:hypothetical protein